jgi:Zn-dependent metalloprotease
MFASNVDPDDWRIGELLPGGALRDMAHPGRVVHEPTGLRPPAHTRDYRVTDADQGGIHINTGIPNRAYVNMVESLGRDDAQHVVYDAVTDHLGRGAGFEDFRTACLKAARAEHGRDSEQYKAVDRAFAKVGLDGKWKAPR